MIQISFIIYETMKIMVSIYYMALAQRQFPDFNFSNLVGINIRGQHSVGLPS
jgi:hypothetical protein